MKVLLLSAADVRRVLTMKDNIAILEAAFAELAAGGVAMPHRPVISVPQQNGSCSFMTAYLPASGALAIKAVSNFKRNPDRGLPTISGTVILFDNETGAVLCIMDGGYLTAIRTGAASGVATKYMARQDAHVAAIIGAGIQGSAQLAAVCEVRDIQTVWVYDSKPENAQRFAGAMAQRGGPVPSDVRVASSPAEAVRAAGILCTATSASAPVFDGNDLQPGVHINGIGSHAPAQRELDTTTIVRSQIVCDSVAACLVEAGDLLLPIQEGRFAKEQIRGGLADVVTGKIRGRQSDAEITLFKSVGLALEDASTALHVYRQARSASIGVEAEL